MKTLLVTAAGDDQQKAAPLGLFVLLLLGVACYFLFKSMSRHLKRVRDDFPIGVGTPSSTAAAPTRPATSDTETAGPGSDDAGRLPPQ